MQLGGGVNINILPRIIRRLIHREGTIAGPNISLTLLVPSVGPVF